MKKIMVCEPVFGREPRQHWPWLEQIKASVGETDTQLECVNLPHGYKIMRTYTRAYNGTVVAEMAFQAEKKGYDAFIIGCASDLGMKEGRSLVNIPVIGSAEATALMACSLGNKFSVITTDPTANARTANLIKSYGLGDRLASVRNAPGLTAHQNFALMAQGHEQQAKVVAMLLEAMRSAIKEDGAEVCYVSCLPTSSMLTMHGVYEVEGAPIISMFSAALKLAESLAALKKSYNTVVCKNSIYLAPHPGWELEIPLRTE